MYGCQLWNSAYEYNFNFKMLKIASNDSFRVLLDVPTLCLKKIHFLITDFVKS